MNFEQLYINIYETLMVENKELSYKKFYKKVLRSLKKQILLQEIEAINSIGWDIFLIHSYLELSKFLKSILIDFKEQNNFEFLICIYTFIKMMDYVYKRDMNLYMNNNDVELEKSVKCEMENHTFELKELIKDKIENELNKEPRR